MIGYGDEEDDDGERKSDEDEEDEKVQVFGSSLQRGSAKHMGAKFAIHPTRANMCNLYTLYR